TSCSTATSRARPRTRRLNSGRTAHGQSCISSDSRSASDPVNGAKAPEPHTRSRFLLLTPLGDECIASLPASVWLWMPTSHPNFRYRSQSPAHLAPATTDHDHETPYLLPTAMVAGTMTWGTLT